ncbi:hypothetical protein MY11210_008807 [Beauveria gryllotalpidicola]
MVNTELDWLEIRLDALYDEVDLFVIVESPRIFHGHDKPLLAKQSWHRFAKYHDKMLHHELKFPGGFRPHGTLSNFSATPPTSKSFPSFSHKWMNGDKFRDRDRIAAAVRDGLDIWGRKGNNFERLQNNTDLPPLVRDDKRFLYLKDQSGKPAGINDYP